jgi:hypothetical protein
MPDKTPAYRISRLRTAKFLLEEQRIRYRLRSEIENNPKIIGTTGSAIYDTHSESPGQRLISIAALFARACLNDQQFGMEANRVQGRGDFVTVNWIHQNDHFRTKLAHGARVNDLLT